MPSDWWKRRQRNLQVVSSLHLHTPQRRGRAGGRRKSRSRKYHETRSIRNMKAAPLKSGGCRCQRAERRCPPAVGRQAAIKSGLTPCRSLVLYLPALFWSAAKRSGNVRATGYRLTVITNCCPKHHVLVDRFGDAAASAHMKTVNMTQEAGCNHAQRDQRLRCDRRKFQKVQYEEKKKGGIDRYVVRLFCGRWIFFPLFEEGYARRPNYFWVCRSV